LLAVACALLASRAPRSGLVLAFVVVRPRPIRASLARVASNDPPSLPTDPRVARSRARVARVSRRRRVTLDSIVRRRHPPDRARASSFAPRRAPRHRRHRSSRAWFRMSELSHRDRVLMASRGVLYGTRLFDVFCLRTVCAHRTGGFYASRIGVDRITGVKV
jgi:hypothetical protein